MSLDLTRFALYFPALLLSFTVHEYAHAWVANRLGDETPLRQGRLTLSPIAHIDPIGSLILPALALLVGGPGTPFLLAWAKPVQTVPRNYTRKVSMWGGMVMVSVAGPLSNLVFGAVAALVFRGLSEAGVQSEFGFQFLFALMVVNVTQFVFNLVPLPPLDGARLYPESWYQVREFVEKYSFMLFIALFILPLGPGRRGIAWVVLEPIMQFALAPLVQLAGLGAEMMTLDFRGR